MEQVFDDCVAERVAAGTTVLLSSHILSEVERLADRVTIIRERPGGRDRHASPSCATCAAARSRAEVAGRGARPRRASPGVHDVVVDGPTVSLLGRPRGAARACSARSPRPAYAR